MWLHLLKFVLHGLDFHIACLQEQGVVFYNGFPLGKRMIDHCLAWYFYILWSFLLGEEIRRSSVSSSSEHKGNLGSIREAVHLNVKTWCIQGSIICSSELEPVSSQFLLSFYRLFKYSFLHGLLLTPWFVSLTSKTLAGNSWKHDFLGVFNILYRLSISFNLKKCLFIIDWYPGFAILVVV